MPQSQNFVLCLISAILLPSEVYRNEEGEAVLFSMEPEVISLPKISIDEYKLLKMGAPDPTDSVWVSFDIRALVFKTASQSSF
jgi:hypothetical protein